MSTDKTPRKTPPRYRHIGPFTINNPTEDDLAKVRSAVDKEYCNYLVFCHENRNREGHTYHLQGYAQGTKAYTLTTWHKILGRFATDDRHPAPNDVKATIQYCKGLKKDENGVYQQKEGSEEWEEFGIKNKPGQRSDLANLKQALDEGQTLEQVQESEEFFSAIMRYKHNIKEYADDLRKKRTMNAILEDYEDIEWKPWQAGILDVIEEKADKRTVNWLYEPTGNIGKSFLTTYLAAQGKAYCPDVTKISDIYYGYKEQPIVIFDIPRSKRDQMEHLYTAMEQFKNGRLFSGKYDSKMQIFRPPHVIVFANFEPQIKMNGEYTISVDRWCIVPLTIQYASKEEFKKSRIHAMKKEVQEQVCNLLSIQQEKRKRDQEQEKMQDSNKRQRTYVI